MIFQVDGFRFDLMGHIMKSTMVRASLTSGSVAAQNYREI